MKEEKTLSSQIIYEGRAVRLRIETVRKPDGEETTREIVEHDDCVAIIAVDSDNNVLMERQYRKAVGKELLEIPAGGIDPGERPATAVRRELREETGYLPRRIKRLNGFHTAPGYCSEYLYLYLATDLVPSPLEAEDTAAIELVRVPLAEIPALLTSGKVHDAKTIAGLFLFLEYLKEHPIH